MLQGDLGFIHRFVAADPTVPDAVTLLLLHGTGGNEADLLPLGPELWPGAALLSPRGKVLENGMPRFFRRFTEGVFDVDDLKYRTDELAAFIEQAAERYQFNTTRVVAVGYSNGANIAASLILRHPRQLRAAVLFRAMVPYEPSAVPDLSEISAFLSAGTHDPIIPPDHPQRLMQMLRSGGADATLFQHRGGHELGQDDLEAAKAWLSDHKIRSRLAA
jgi:phospholipase/carboxylesterase/glyoxalase family protein